MRLLAVAATLLLFSQCARAPRPAPARQGAKVAPQTRSTPLGGPARVDHTESLAIDQPGCTLALQLPAGLLDCHFAACPEAMLLALLSAAWLHLETGADGLLGLTEHRTEPPLRRRIATLVQVDGAWQLTANGKHTGACGKADPLGLGEAVTGISIRRILAETKTR